MDSVIKRAAAKWHLDVQAIRHDIVVCGSPDRCESRFVIETADNGMYLMESLKPADLRRKKTIIRHLAYLHENNLSGITPYIRNRDGTYITAMDHRYFQLSRFVEGVALNRPDYVFEKWRGPVLANFLIDLHRVSRKMPFARDKGSFSIVCFINALFRKIATHEPALIKKIQPVMDFLAKDFFSAHDRLPKTFCHGDFHALNIIWSDTGICAVIDWEFSGIKPEVYDMANMIGCIGIENPEALAGNLVTDFILRIRESGMISTPGWHCLLSFVVATRFAWLSEWLRHQDQEMIDMETDYMTILLNNRHELNDIWKI